MNRYSLSSWLLDDGWLHSRSVLSDIISGLWVEMDAVLEDGSTI